jgi:FKBP-type peptidyl-prolyl cis-trans isomerase FkpA
MATNQKDVIATGIAIVMALVVIGYYLYVPRFFGADSAVVNEQVTKNNQYTSQESSVSTAEILSTQEKVIYEDISAGTGETVRTGDIVVVHYVGRFLDGTQFASSYDTEMPIRFQIGHGSVIQGWERGIVGMRVGGERVLIVPPVLGYGEQGSGIIPPHAYLLFDIEVLDMQSANATSR